MINTNTIYPFGTILNDNSFELLPKFTSKSIDVILTDIPYDLAQDEKFFLFQEFNRIAKRCFIVFSPPENQFTFPGISTYLFWIKPISTKNTTRNYSRFVEMIFVYNLENAIWNCDRHWSQYTNVF